ncbi:hypothetical protein OG709_29990 [Streptomyces sp. NBC_01267]|uniref:hypothetical protein n=1 Tax=Streptomyces sp. NBC_01267 TaxID=2903805 RepID=UPI002E3355EC|nr:hypothetical protein [Streptomyces sp. NBC_01267]
MENPDTGGWGLTSSYSDPGTLCLYADEGGMDIVYNDNPLTVSQLRALANVLNQAAADLAADLTEEN